MSEEIDAAKNRMLEPQYRHNWLRLLQGLHHHRILLAQPKTTAESRYEHQDGWWSMVVKNLDSASPPPECPWRAINLAFQCPCSRTALTDRITCGTGSDHQHTLDRSSRKDLEQHLVAQQHSSMVMPSLPKIGMCRFWTVGKKDA